MAEPSTLLASARQLPWWPAARDNLAALWASNGASARRETLARAYRSVYAGNRAAMVVDVVVSRQRHYTTRVVALVRSFQASQVTSLSDLAAIGTVPVGGLRGGESDTIVGVAAGLVAWNQARPTAASDDETLVSEWAAYAAPFDVAPRLDPFVGRVKGIGPALFAYLRMRSGGDAIKPDGRVRDRLKQLGFEPPAGEVGLLLTAKAAAEELGVRRIELDQLLWPLPAR